MGSFHGIVDHLGLVFLEIEYLRAMFKLQESYTFELNYSRVTPSLHASVA